MSEKCQCFLYAQQDVLNRFYNAMVSTTPLPVCDDMRVSQRCLCLIMHVQMDKLHDPRVLFHMYTAK